jgi:guanine nucleotide-binding protein G(i) subunit alpha
MLVKTNFILFFNKKDLLEAKLAVSPLSNYFPDWTGNNNDLKETIHFLKSKFLRTRKDNVRTVYTYLTQATDQKQVASILKAIKDIVVNKHFEAFGLA